MQLAGGETSEVKRKKARKFKDFYEGNMRNTVSKKQEEQAGSQSVNRTYPGDKNAGDASRSVCSTPVVWIPPPEFQPLESGVFKNEAVSALKRINHKEMLKLSYLRMLYDIMKMHEKA